MKEDECWQAKHPAQGEQERGMWDVERGMWNVGCGMWLDYFLQVP